MENLKEIRWKQRFENFDKSYKLLKKYSHKPIVTELERAGIIQFFEMTFELAWKTLKDYLEYLRISSNTGSPREVLKESYAHNLIENGEVWIKMMLARNSLSHLYDEEESRKIYEDIKNKYIFEIEKLVEFIEYK